MHGVAWRGYRPGHTRLGAGDNAMLERNSGIQLLRCMTEHVHSAVSESADYDLWHADRGDVVMAGLSDAAKDPRVDVFIDAYAESLAERIINLLEADAIEESLDACIDFWEETLRQAQLYAAALEAPEPTAVQPNLPGAQWPTPNMRQAA